MKRRDTCTQMFILTMPTIAKLWKLHWCPSKDEWIKKMWFMYTMEYYSAIRTTNTHHLLQRGWNWRVLC